MSDFAAFWNDIYPDAQPVGYRMRAAGAEHWVRFHSLPLSKRYPETADDRSILLARQNELADKVLGEGQVCWLVQTCWVTPKDYIDAANDQISFLETRKYSLQRAFTFREYEEDEDACNWNVMAGLLQWSSGDFDKVLLRIAEEEAAPTLWVSTGTGATFAPYDGGVDLFVTSAVQAEALRTRYKDWLSPSSTGL